MSVCLGAVGVSCLVLLAASSGTSAGSITWLGRAQAGHKEAESCRISINWGEEGEDGAGLESSKGCSEPVLRLGKD